MRFKTHTNHRYMCACGFPDEENIHWYTDRRAPMMYMLAHSPEEAEYNLRSWAGRLVKNGHLIIDMRPVAARVLATKRLYMQSICARLTKELPLN